MKKSILLILTLALSLSLSAQNVFVRDQKIVVEMVGQETVLAPNGPDESYFWVSLSPDRKHIAYSTAHHGTFVCDLHGKNVKYLGVMGAPTWMDDEMVAGMYEYTDPQTEEKAMRYLCVSRDGKMSRNLTDHEAEWLVDHEKTRLENLRTRNFARIAAKRAVMATKNNTVGLAGIKIYLNPGHGGYDPNDRSCWTVHVPELWTNPDGYWESKSNLVKGLFLRDMLEKAGATVIISRTQNRSGWRDIIESQYYDYAPGTPEYEAIINGDDRQLSAIAEEANANEVDHFLSIHSNALNSRTNYLLMLFRGKGGPGIAYEATTPPSFEMATLAGSIQIKNPLTVWSSATPLVRGDITFYDPSWNGLGVLRPLTVPGHLSEGSFHDYPPETHRLMNDDYCHLEALRMFQYFHKWFQRELPQTACISGFVKSSNQLLDELGYKEFYYFPNTDDQWLPLNGAKVTLCDAEGHELQTKTTDDWYNGIFAFYDLEPGTYIVRAEKGGYIAKEETVTVAAEDIAGVKFFLPYTRVDLPDFEEPVQDAGTLLLPEYSFVPDGQPVATAAGYRRVLYRNGKVYALSADGGSIAVCDLMLNAERSVAAPAGVTFADITFSADNFLLAGVEADNHWQIYLYDPDLTEATLMIDQTVTGHVSGTLTASAPYWKATLSTTTATDILTLAYNEDHPESSQLTTTARTGLDNNSRLTLQPDGKVYVSDKAMLPCFFRYAQRNLMAKPEVQNGVLGFRLWDVTESETAISPFIATTANGERAHAYAYVDKYEMHIYIVTDGVSVQHFVSNIAEVPNIYASELNYKDGMFTFRLNTDATRATLRLEKDGQSLGSFELGAMAMGAHEIPNPANTTDFDAYELTVSAEPVSYPALISDNDKIFNFATPIGVAVDRTPNSPFFGRIYVTDAQGGSAGQRTTTQGIYVLSSDFADVTEQGNTAYKGDVKWGEHNPGKNYQLAIARPAVAPNGDVFVPSATASSSGVYIMDPANPSAAFTPVFDGKRNSVSGKIKKDGVVVANPVMHCVITGYGDKRRLYTMDHDIASTTLSSSIWRYNIGAEELPWGKAPSDITYNDQQYGKMQNGSGQIARDGRGGWWLSQYRYTSTEAVPPLIHVTDGKMDLNVGGTIATAQQGGMAVTTDGSLVAIGRELGTIAVYEATYNAKGKPTLKERNVISYGTNFEECVTMGCDFDAAGNLYVVTPTDGKLYVFTMPNLNNTFTTRRSAILEDDPYEKPDPEVGVNNVSNDEAQPRKLIRDGQLIIRRGNDQYNAQGVRL